jgi:CBS-domain-containing membrane protein
VKSVGASTIESNVFCPLLARSTPLDRCGHCKRRRQVENGGAAIVCDIDLPRHDGDSPGDWAEAAARTNVGELVSLESTCVHEDVAGDLVVAVLNANRRCVPVVTASGGLVGIVCPGALFRGAPAGSAMPTARDLARPIDVVLTEDMPLSVAIGVMAHSREAELPVLSSAGAVTGMLRSADVVSWMAARLGYAT